MLNKTGVLLEEIELRDITYNGEERTVIGNKLLLPRESGGNTVINVTAWDGAAEEIAQRYNKGDEIRFDGDLRSKFYKTGGNGVRTHYILINKILPKIDEPDDSE
jgi:single-stranded DNA-binding protein